MSYDGALACRCAAPRRLAAALAAAAPSEDVRPPSHTEISNNRVATLPIKLVAARLADGRGRRPPFITLVRRTVLGHSGRRTRHALRSERLHAWRRVVATDLCGRGVVPPPGA